VGKGSGEGQVGLDGVGMGIGEGMVMNGYFMKNEVGNFGGCANVVLI